ncbi:hypothetical protein [Brevibacterium yomogidense]|uniref:hypothetical protein n=1 Tax=Brevibacterium yomogidense TaxID=946573 RepID=UPI0018DFA043|nr:hypothetical protein [Brevibacterium yomogidense]
MTTKRASALDATLKRRKEQQSGTKPRPTFVGEAPATEGVTKLSVRLPSDLHRKLKIKAVIDEQSIQELVVAAIERLIEAED